MGTNAVPADEAESDAPRDDEAKWACTVCTYENFDAASKCAMCLTVRLQLSASPSTAAVPEVAVGGGGGEQTVSVSRSMPAGLGSGSTARTSSLANAGRSSLMNNRF